MIAVLVVSFFISLLGKFEIRGLFLPFAIRWQDACLYRFTTSLGQEVGGALVCGTDLTSLHLRQTFLAWGIYHILVVSGSHLIFLSHLLDRGIQNPKVKFFLLLSFALMTGLEAPVVRAVFQLFWLAQIPPGRVHRPRAILFSYLTSLVFSPSWITSLSLHLSFFAAMAVTLGRTPWTRALWLAILTLPLTLPWGTTSLSGWILGLILSPWIEAVFFPSALFVWIFGFEEAWTTWLAKCLEALESYRILATGDMKDSPVPWAWSWPAWNLPLLVFLFIVYLQIKRPDFHPAPE